MQLTRKERITDIEAYLIQNKKGSDCKEFTEMKTLTYSYLGLNIELDKEYNVIKCHSIDDAIDDAIILILQGVRISDAIQQASGMYYTNFYSLLNVGQMGKLQQAKTKYKTSK